MTLRSTHVINHVRTHQQRFQKTANFPRQQQRQPIISQQQTAHKETAARSLTFPFLRLKSICHLLDTTHHSLTQSHHTHTHAHKTHTENTLGTQTAKPHKPVEWPPSLIHNAVYSEWKIFFTTDCRYLTTVTSHLCAFRI
jgi:hypothetical protein